MAIDRINPQGDPSRVVDGVRSTGRQAGSEDIRADSKEPKGDRVEISDRSREVQQVRQLLDLTPDTRADKVQAVKQSIENNLYNVRGEQVADRLIGGAILNDLG